MYIYTKGETSVRFTDYQYTNEKETDGEIKECENTNFMNIEILEEASNPYNFVNKVPTLLTGEDANNGLAVLQQKALINLEQLSINNWSRIKEFLNDYFYYRTISGLELGEVPFYGKRGYCSWMQDLINGVLR